jgi:hypothetical protein
MDVINSCVHRNELTVKQQIAARSYVGSVISIGLIDLTLFPRANDGLM